MWLRKEPAPQRPGSCILRLEPRSLNSVLRVKGCPRGIAAVPPLRGEPLPAVETAGWEEPLACSSQSSERRPRGGDGYESGYEGRRLGLWETDRM